MVMFWKSIGKRSCGVLSWPQDNDWLDSSNLANQCEWVNLKGREEQKIRAGAEDRVFRDPGQGILQPYLSKPAVLCG